LSVGVTLSNINADILHNKTIQDALIMATEASIGGSPNVTISRFNVIPRSSLTLDRFDLFESETELEEVDQPGYIVQVIFAVRQLAEKLGYSSNSANLAASVMISKLQNSVTTGSYSQILLSASISGQSSAFVGVTLSNVTTSDLVVDYLLTANPSAIPTPSPTLRSIPPTAFPSQRISSSGPRSKTTSEIPYVVTSAIGFVILAAGCAVYITCIRNRRRGQPCDKFSPYRLGRRKKLGIIAESSVACLEGDLDMPLNQDLNFTVLKPSTNDIRFSVECRPAYVTSTFSDELKNAGEEKFSCNPRPWESAERATGFVF